MLLILNLWNDVLFCGGAIIGRPFLVPLSPPLSRLCRQLPSMGALLIPILEEWWHAVSEWWLLFDVLFFPAGDQWSPLHSFFVGAVIGRPFLVSKTSYRTAPSTSLLLPSFPFPHSNTLRQADRLALFINLLHLCRSCYPLFFVCDRRQNPNLTLFLSSLYCFQFRHFRLLHRLRKPYTFHLF